MAHLMVANLEFIVSDASVRETIKTLPREMHTALHRAFELDAAEWDSRMQWRTSSGSLHRRTGRLARSLGWAVTGKEINDLQLRAFASGDIPGKIHALEFGATVLPKRGKYLTIPIGANLRAGSGTVRYPSARKLFSDDPKNVFVLTAKSGRKFIVRRTGNKKLEFLFLLKKKTEMPGPRGLHPAPRPGGSYLGFFYEWRNRQESRTKRHQEAVGEAIAAAVKNVPAASKFTTDF